MKLNYNIFHALILSISLTFLASCSQHKSDAKDEQIAAINSDDEQPTADSNSNSIKGNIAFNQITTTPNNVILTGLLNYRLVSIYKTRPQQATNIVDKVRSYSDAEYVGSESDEYQHYMPGIDILFGYKLLNLSHYDFVTEKQHLFFNKPVLIKTLYFPSYEQDSLNKQAINRNYYFVSVYDEDTNKDTLINRKDLRRFYLFDETATIRTALLPLNYSVSRSQYDYKNDYMFLFAKCDNNKNGIIDKFEPTHIFWINLKNPQKAKRLY